MCCGTEPSSPSPDPAAMITASHPCRSTMSISVCAGSPVATSCTTCRPAASSKAIAGRIRSSPADSFTRSSTSGSCATTSSYSVAVSCTFASTNRAFKPACTSRTAWCTASSAWEEPSTGMRMFSMMVASGDVMSPHAKCGLRGS